jgi:hypothetical protein
MTVEVMRAQEPAPSRTGDGADDQNGPSSVRAEKSVRKSEMDTCARGEWDSKRVAEQIPPSGYAPLNYFEHAHHRTIIEDTSSSTFE